MVFPPGNGTSFTIGRTQDCDLRIADMSVSRLHAQLDRREEGWLLSDLGSHNGTRVNGWLVREPVPVRAGDLLQFGSALFVIQPDPPRHLSPLEPYDASASEEAGAIWGDELPPNGL
jgi:pSer/pThr/pTyr-binding forkhead associated (FHA) protein